MSQDTTQNQDRLSDGTLYVVQVRNGGPDAFDEQNEEEWLVFAEPKELWDYLTKLNPTDCFVVMGTTMEEDEWDDLQDQEV